MLVDRYLKVTEGLMIGFLNNSRAELNLRLL